MKLHLPLSLLSSLLACMAAVSSPHAVAETYTWLGGTVDVHLNTNWTPDYGSSNWSATWAGTATNSMRFDAGSMTGQVKALQASFNTLSLGGITVTDNSDGFSVSKSNGSNRTVNLRDGGEGYTLFDIGGDFSLGVASQVWNGVVFNSNALFKIASGKTMNIYGGLGTAGTGTRTMTVGADGFAGILILNTAAQSSMTADWVISHGATVQLNNAAALGSGSVSLNGGNITAQHDTVYNNALAVSGSSGMTVNAATRFASVSLSNAAVLNMNGGTLGIANAGVLTLGSSGTITGNLTLGNASLLNFSALPASGAYLLNVTGTLTVDSELLLGQGTIEGVTWTEGSYSLVHAGSVEGVPASSFVLGDNLLGSWSTENNNLTLVVEQVALLEWKGGDGIWSVTAPASSPWKNDGVYNNASGVVMGDIDGSSLQTVTIDGVVSPSIMMVQADTTDYVWNAADGGGALEGSGNLEKTGSAKLTINMDNADYAGKVILGGGRLK